MAAHGTVVGQPCKDVDMDSIPWSDWPTNLWGYSVGGDARVNFCVQALLVDGLRSPPFNRHPEGTGRIRQAGLTAELWDAWFRRTVLDGVLREAEGLWPAWKRSAEWPPSRELLNPPEARPQPALSLWDGSETVTEELSQLPWTEAPFADGRSWYRSRPTLTPEIRLHMGNRFAGGDPGALWDKLERFRGRVPHIWIYIVEYPAITYTVVEPAAIVLSHRIVLNPPIYHATVVAAFEALSN
jgi:hypothetical protein